MNAETGAKAFRPGKIRIAGSRRKRAAPIPRNASHSRRLPPGVDEVGAIYFGMADLKSVVGLIRVNGGLSLAPGAGPAMAKKSPSRGCQREAMARRIRRIASSMSFRDMSL